MQGSVERTERQVALDRLLARAVARQRNAAPPPESADAVTRGALLRAVAAAWGLSVAILTGSSRQQAHVRPRAAFAWLAENRLGAAPGRIGDALGRRDYTTVLNLLNKGQALIADDPEFRLKVARVEQLLFSAPGEAPKTKSAKALQDECETWNVAHRVGARVSFTRPDGEEIVTRTRSRAQTVSGRGAVVWLEAVMGCCPLSSVRALDGAVAGGEAA